jgi:hypothetical protein
MIIVTANVGLLPSEIGKKRVYITDKRLGFFIIGLWTLSAYHGVDFAKSG